MSKTKQYITQNQVILVCGFFYDVIIKNYFSEKKTFLKSERVIWFHVNKESHPVTVLQTLAMKNRGTIR